MQKKRNTRSIDGKDISAGIFCLAGMTVALFLFWNDLNVSLARQNEQPIAVIYFKYNTAQRRLQNRNLWERLQQASPIYNGDRIRTASSSEAYTIFNDGNRLDIHENTLVQVFATKTGNDVQFIDGAISVSAASVPANFRIVSGTKEISFEKNTSATFTAAKDKTVTAIVSNGAVNITDVKVPSSPAAKLISYVTSGTDLYSVLNAKNDADKAVVLPATEKEHSDSDAKKIAAGNTFTFSINANVSAPQTADSDINVFMPTTTYSLVHAAGQTAYLPVHWNSSAALVLLFAHNNDFAHPVASRMLPAGAKNSYIALDFADDTDTLYWRATPVQAPDDSQFPSGILFVRLPEEKPVSLIARDAFGPDQSAHIQLIVEKADKDNAMAFSQQEVQAGSGPAITSAASVKSADDVQNIGSEAVPQLQEPAAAGKAEQPAAVAAPARPAAKKMSAAPAAAPQVPGFVEKTPSLTAPVSGKVFTDSNFASDDPQIHYAWNPVNGAQSYVFAIYSGNKKVLTRTVKKTSYILSGDGLSLLENGTFSWTVTAAAKIGGREYQSKTGTSSFVIKLSDLNNVEIDTSSLLKAD